MRAGLDGIQQPEQRVPSLTRASQPGNARPAGTSSLGCTLHADAETGATGPASEAQRHRGWVQTRVDGPRDRAEQLENHKLP